MDAHGACNGDAHGFRVLGLQLVKLNSGKPAGLSQQMYNVILIILPISAVLMRGPADDLQCARITREASLYNAYEVAE